MRQMEVAMQLHYPALAAPFDSALQAAVADVLAQYDPVGIIAAGSVIHAASVVRAATSTSMSSIWRAFANGCSDGTQECRARSCQPADQVRRYFEDEHFHGRPITAHLLATGTVLLDQDPIVQNLRNEAAKWLATAPTPGDERLRWLRYLLVDQADNVRDVAAVNPALARLLLGEMLPQLATYCLPWLPAITCRGAKMS